MDELKDCAHTQEICECG